MTLLRLVLWPMLITLCVAHGVALGARSWTGVVTSVVDGDTLWVRPDSANHHPTVRQGSSHVRDNAQDIRIDGIDAPEICQAYGLSAKKALTDRVLQQNVVVTERRADRYGRALAKITLAGDDVGDWMVRHGHAWSYHFHRSAGPYAAQESIAYGARRGLFADPVVEQPRDFRRRHGSCHL